MNCYQQVRKRLLDTTQINWIASISDIQQQLEWLIYKGFLQQTPVEKLTELPRHLEAMQMRLEKLKHAAARDIGSGTSGQAWTSGQACAHAYSVGILE